MTDRTPTTTRRAVLAGSVALPALALPAIVPAPAVAAAPAAADDPAVRAFREFVPAFRRWEAAANRRGQMADFGPDVDHEALALADAEQDAASAAEIEALDALASAEATTAAGARCQLLALAYMTAELNRDGDILDMAEYHAGQFGPEDLDLANRMARALDGALIRLAEGAPA